MQCRDQRGEQRDDDELRADGGQDGAAQHEEHAQPMRAGADDHGAGAGRSRSVLESCSPGAVVAQRCAALAGGEGQDSTCRRQVAGAWADGRRRWPAFPYDCGITGKALGVPDRLRDCGWTLPGLAIGAFLAILSEERR